MSRRRHIEHGIDVLSRNAQSRCDGALRARRPTAAANGIRQHVYAGLDLLFLEATLKKAHTAR